MTIEIKKDTHKLDFNFRCRNQKSATNWIISSLRVIHITKIQWKLLKSTFPWCHNCIILSICDVDFRLLCRKPSGTLPIYFFSFWATKRLTHWGRVTHICVGNLTIIGSDNGLSPCRRLAIIWTNSGILSIGPLETNSSEILNEIDPFSFKKMHLKTSSDKRRPFCIVLNVLRAHYYCHRWL